MCPDRDSKPSIPAAGKLGEFAFQGQHSFRGGFSSCVANTTYALGIFSHMSDVDFFNIWSPPTELNIVQIKIACEALSYITHEGNKLSIKNTKIKAADKVKDEQKIEVKASRLKFYKFFFSKEFSRLLTKIKSSMHGYLHIKDLVIMNEVANCHETMLLHYIKTTYKDLEELGLRQNDIMFLSGAVFHEVALFAKTRPADGKTFYYIYDTAPARALGGRNNIGIMEIHNNLETAVHSLKLRWKINYFLNATVASMYAITTNKRISKLRLSKLNNLSPL